MKKHICLLAFCPLVFVISASARAGDWPAFMHDNRRSCVTGERLELPLKESWVLKAIHEPKPAWPPAAKQDIWHNHYNLRSTVTYDRAFAVVGAGDSVFFGSSADGKVYALDAMTGQQRWTFFTEGPVRLAPAVVGGKVYVGSDDGCVYCLWADDGSLVWKYKVADQDRIIPGNGAMISMQPVRSGLVVDAGNVYFTAGLFPDQGTYLFALNADDGSVKWKQRLNISPQGYMLASGERLYVPTGRTSPAMFSRADGRYLGELSSAGGAYALLTEDVFITGPGRALKEISASDVKTKEKIASFGGLRMLVNGSMAYMQSEGKLSAFNRSRYIKLSRQKNALTKRHHDINGQLNKLQKNAPQAKQLKGYLRNITMELEELSEKLKDCYLWTVECEYPYSAIMSGGILFAGGDNKVAAFDTEDGKVIWSAPVQGKAFGLSVINGGLYVSTDKGRIHCFRSDVKGDSRVITAKTDINPFPYDDLTKVYAEAAQRIVEQTAIRKGYCLVIGCGRGRLACELARLTDLKIIAVEADAGKVAAARKAIDKAGLSGRVVVHHNRRAKLPYTKYFANLIVSDDTLRTGKLPPSAEQIFKLLRPSGGVVALAVPAGRYKQDSLKRWSKNSITGWKVHKGDKIVLAWAGREKLKGAGQWTHTYAEPGNTACSGDELVKGQMAIQWFGRPGPRNMIDRHHRNVPPLSHNGRLFVPGDSIIFAVDAYNGTILWDVRIPNSRRLGIVLDCGNMAVDEQFLYVVAEDKCYGFDVQNGRCRQTYTMPQLVKDEPRDWGYITYNSEAIFGSGCRKGASYTQTGRDVVSGLYHRNTKLVVSEYLFAMDKKSSKLLWKYKDGLIVNTTITVGGGRMYFIETHNPKALANKSGRVPAKILFNGGNQYLVALDLKTGRVVYRKKIDAGNFQELVYQNYAKDILILSGCREAGKTVHYYLHAYDADTGRIRWQATHDSGLPRDGGHGEYNRHPTIIDNTVYAWPYSYNLKTGKQIEGWRFDRHGGGCGAVSASAQCLFWRGSNPWMYDLGPKGGPSRLNSVSRPGCWINIIPAGGLVLIPEASSGCTCGYPLQTSIALVPK